MLHGWETVTLVNRLCSTPGMSVCIRVLLSLQSKLLVVVGFIVGVRSNPDVCFIWARSNLRLEMTLAVRLVIIATSSWEQ